MLYTKFQGSMFFGSGEKDFYNTSHYNTALDITWFKDGSQICIDYTEQEKWLMALWTSFSVQFWNKLLTLAEKKAFFSKKSKWSHFQKKKKNTSPRAKRFPFAFNQVSAQPDIILEQMWFKDGHCGRHLGFQNRKILAILNLHLAPMPSIKFQINLTFGLGGDVVWRVYNFYPKNASYWYHQWWLYRLNHWSYNLHIIHNQLENAEV